MAVHRVGEQPDTFEIGVTLAQAHQGRGLATEAVTRLLEFLFDEVGAHRVVACCDSRNEAVAALLQRVGMRQESRQLEADMFKGEWTNLDRYAISMPQVRAE